MADTSAVSATVQKLVSDSREATRKKAITEVADTTKRFYEDYPPDEADDQALKFFQTFENNLLKSTQPLARRAGVSALAALTCALPRSAAGEHRIKLIETLSKAILRHFKDPDVVVRTLAVEAMLNVVTHLQANALKCCFGDLYMQMLAVASDKDAKVQQACAELSNSVKEVGAEHPAAFNMREFVHFVDVGLTQHQTSPEALCFVIDWINNVQAVPGRNMMVELKHFLGSLLQLVSHSQKMVCSKTEQTLDSFREKLRAHASEIDVRELAREVLRNSGDSRVRTRQVCAEWLSQLLAVGRERLLPITDLLLKEMINRISDSDVKAADKTRSNLEVLAEFLTIAAHPGSGTGSGLGQFAAGASRNASVISPNDPTQLTKPFLGSVDDHQDGSLAAPPAAVSTSTAGPSPDGAAGTSTTEGAGATEHLTATPSGPNQANSSVHTPLAVDQGIVFKLDDVNFVAVIEVLTSSLTLPKQSRLDILRWSVLIHRLKPNVIAAHFHTLFPALLNMVTDPDGDVLDRTIEVTATIAGQENFSHFIKELLNYFEEYPELLSKVSIVFKRLQRIYMPDPVTGVSPAFSKGENHSSNGILAANSADSDLKYPDTCEKLFLQTAALLRDHENKRFVATMVIKLTSMLLTADEFFCLRELLKLGTVHPRSNTAFLGLYECWCYNPVSAIALSLLTRAFGLTYELVERLGSQEVPVTVLVQLDRLVQLIESPVFAFVRLALLKPRKNTYLVKALFGMMMILPQGSPQFGLLRQRLKAVTAVSSIANSDLKDNWEEGAPTEWDGLASKYELVQAQLLAYEIESRSTKQ
jgi:vacuole morphology and inheritance protein 14